MEGLRAGVSSAALFALLLIFLLLGRTDAAGPPHAELVLDGGVPATLYVAGSGSAGRSLPDPLPPAERPPGVVLAHGFAGDRAGVSVLARSLAAAGYTVLSIEFRGHGANRNSFTVGRGRGDFLYEDLAAAVDHLRGSPYADGGRTVVMGHSMGAGAALEYGTRDPGIDGVVLISGGWRMTGAYRPSNPLFIYAAGDPERIRSRAQALAARVAGLARLDPGRIYGDFRTGTAVRQVEVRGANYTSILTSSEAVGEIVDWLDRIFEIERGVPAQREDPRFGLAIVGYAAFVLVLPGLGALIGRLSPSSERHLARARWVDLATLALVLAATLPIFAVGHPGAFLPLEVADILVPHLALAGVALLVVMQLSGRLTPAIWLRGAAATLIASTVGLVGIYVLLTPLGVVVHRLTLTPERAALALLAMLLLLPFTLSFNELLRRGRNLEASAMCIGGRILVLLIVGLGVAVDISHPVVGLMLPMLAILFFLFELLSASIYATSRSIGTIAVVEATWLAWILAAVLPIRI